MSKERLSQAAQDFGNALSDMIQQTTTDLERELAALLQGQSPPSTPDDGDTPSKPSKPTNSSFRLYDNIRYSGKPRHTELGLAPCKIIYQNDFDIPDNGNLPSESHIKSMARGGDDELTCLDIEHHAWLKKSNWDFVDGGDSKFAQVGEWWREAKDDGQRFGFYGVTTARNVWDALEGPGERKHDWWMGVNDKGRKIVQEVDVLFPTLYAFHDDIATWEKYAKGNVDEARRTGAGKPVIPYIWPQFHSSAVEGTPKRGHIPAKHWRAQLEFCYEHCDGAVIWTLSGETKHVPWSKVPAFWPETERFLKQL